MIREQVSNRLVRIHSALREDIENTRLKKYNGLIPFTQASYDYFEEKKKLEADNLKYRKKIEELTNSNMQPRRTRLL